MRQTGFTLVELVVVMAIIAILTAIVMPMYGGYVLRSHRTAAVNALQELASREATYFTTNNAYTSSLATLGYTADPMPVPSPANYYNMNVQALTNGNGSAGFTLRAVPVGNQATDSCGTFTLDALGQRGVSGATSTSQTCWGY